MRALVKRAYTDRFTGEVHLPGSVVDEGEARVAELEGGGFVERGAAEPEPEPAAEAEQGEGEAPGRPDFSTMTVAMLKEYIAQHGGEVPKGRPRHAELQKIAEAL